MALFKEFAAFLQVWAESPEQGVHADVALVRRDVLAPRQLGKSCSVSPA